MTDRPTNAFEALLEATGYDYTRVREVPDDVARLNRINRAWLADDERAQRMPAVIDPDEWFSRGCWGTP